MRLVDMENDLKKLISNNIKDEKIYTKIYDLSAYFLRWKKAVPESDIDGISHIIAEELYLKIYNGSEISSWLGYISRFYHAAIRTWRYLNSSELIDANNDYELSQSIISMCTSDDSLSSSYQDTSNRLYFDSLPKIVENVMTMSRYIENTKDYMNAKLSIILSLCSNKFISYNLSESEEIYTRMLYNFTKDKIVEDIKDNNSSNDCYLSSFNLMQLFTLSNAEICN